MTLHMQSINALPSTDIAIIGAGPVGLFAVFQAGMLNLSTHVFDSLDVIGGQCAELYPEKPIYDIPAFPSLTGGELIQNLAAQAAPFKPTYHLGQSVVSIERLDESKFLVKTSSGYMLLAKVIMVAGGSGLFTPIRPELTNLSEFEGQSVFYSVRDPKAFAGKRIAIAGGGDSAVDWAIVLSKWADHIYMIHRRDRFRAAPESISRMNKLVQQKKIELIVPYQLDGLYGSAGKLNRVSVSTMGGDKRLLEADILLPLFGLVTDLGPISNWGLIFDNGSIVVNPADCATNILGVYAIGDNVKYPGKLKLILTGFAEAASATHAAYYYISPDKPLHSEHSTTRGVPSLAMPSFNTKANVFN